MKPSITSGTHCVAFLGEAPDAGFGLWLADGIIQGRAGSSIVANPSAIASGEWHHVAFFVQNGKASLRVDGAQTTILDGVTLPASVKTFGVGAMADGTNGFEGVINELRLFEVPATGFDPDSQLLFSAKPVSSVNTTQLDFGNLSVGSGRSQAFALTNDGPGWLRIVGAELSAPGAADYSVSAYPARPIQPDPPSVPQYGPIFTIISYGVSLPPQDLLNSSARADLPPGTLMIVNVTLRTSQSVATGPRNATLTLTTNDPVNPVRVIALNGNISDVPQIAYTGATNVSWGSVLTNDNFTLSLPLVNRGSGNLTVSYAVEGANPEDITGQPDFSANLAPVLPGNSFNATIVVQPKAEGARQAVLRIDSNDPVTPVLRIPLYGRGLRPAPEMYLSVQSIIPEFLPAKYLAQGQMVDFGSAFSGSGVNSTNVNISCGGSDDLRISSLQITGQNAADFVLPANLPAVVARNQSSFFLIQFKPSAVGQRQATLVIESNDRKHPHFEVPLVGTGLVPGPVLRLVEGAASAGGYSGDSPLARAFLPLGTAVIRDFRDPIVPLRTRRMSLKNTGPAALGNPSITFKGPAAGDFSATLTGPIGVGEMRDVIVTFDPSDIGPRSAVMHINGDSGISFDIPVGGTGAYGTKATLAPVLPTGWVGTALAQMPDGSVLLAGHYPENGSERYALFQIDKSGQPAADLSKIFMDGPVASIAVDAQGQVFLAGSFAHIHTMGWHSLATNPDWASQGVSRLDGPFTTLTGDFVGRAVVALPDGKILVGGKGSLGGRANLIRLNADGSLDTTFTLPQPDAAVNALALQDDGKVVIGGEFTNLGQEYIPGPQPHTGMAQLNLGDGGLFISIGGILTLGSPVHVDPTGLCRMNADGTNDTSFGNPGFHKVTSLAVKGDRIAVGGVDRHTFEYQTYYALTASSLGYGGWPYNYSNDTPSARLLALNGQTLASSDMEHEPTAVALLPGDRMLVAPGNTSFYPLNLRPGVAMIQPASEVADAWGVKIVPAPVPPSPVPEATAGPIILSTGATVTSPTLTLAINEYRVQEFDGTVNAILPQADGKVLVAGGTTMACVVGFDGSGTLRPIADVPSGLVLTPTTSNPPSVVPVPEAGETPVSGFLQLDSDGFYNRPAPAANGLSDGLGTVVLGEAGVYEELVSTAGKITSTFITGPQADEYTWRSVTDGTGIVRFDPLADGVRYAVLHLMVEGYADPIELALFGHGSLAIEKGVQLTDEAGHLINPGDITDFGTGLLGTVVTKTFKLVNTSDKAVSAPFALAAVGDNTSDFTIPPSITGPIPAHSSTSFQITFKSLPGVRENRAATVQLRQQGVDGAAYLFRLAGVAVVQPVVSASPADSLVMVGSSLTLSAQVANDGPVVWRWYKNDVALSLISISADGSKSTLVVPNVSLADAGLYTARATNMVGMTKSQAAKVGVVAVPPKTVGVVEQGSATLECLTAGPGIEYQWVRNDQPVRNAVASKLVVAGYANQLGDYSCRLHLGTAAIVSPAIHVILTITPQFVSDTSAVAPWVWSVGQPVNQTLQAINNPAKYMVTGLPPGVVVNSATGVISGKPRSAGHFSARIIAANVAGQSMPWMQEITVAPLNPDLVGSFTGLLARDALTDQLGGLFSVTITSTGEFSGKAKLGVRSNARGNTVDYPFIGSLTFSNGGVVETLVVAKGPAGLPPLSVSLIPALQGKMLNLSITRDSVTYSQTPAQKCLSRSEWAAGPQGQRKASLLDNKAVARGRLTLISASGSAFWVCKHQSGADHITLTGTSPIDVTSSVNLFAPAARAAGARSLTGSVTLSSDWKGSNAGELVWGDWGGVTDSPSGRLRQALKAQGIP